MASGGHSGECSLRTRSGAHSEFSNHVGITMIMVNFVHSLFPPFPSAEVLRL